jgi:hypothetical protein
MSTRRLIITYEAANSASEEELVINEPPMLYDDFHYLIFAKGIFADKKVEYLRILNVSTVMNHWSLSEEGLKALNNLDKI